MPVKWVPNAAAMLGKIPRKILRKNLKKNPMTCISDFVQQSHNFIASW